MNEDEAIKRFNIFFLRPILLSVRKMSIVNEGNLDSEFSEIWLVSRYFFLSTPHPEIRCHFQVSWRRWAHRGVCRGRLRAGRRRACLLFVVKIQLQWVELTGHFWKPFRLTLCFCTSLPVLEIQQQSEWYELDWWRTFEVIIHSTLSVLYSLQLRIYWS